MPTIYEIAERVSKKAYWHEVGDDNGWKFSTTEYERDADRLAEWVLYHSRPLKPAPSLKAGVVIVLIVYGASALLIVAAWFFSWLTAAEQKEREPMSSNQAVLPNLERFDDGSAVWQTEHGKWKAWWTDGTPLRGQSPETGMEVDWFFDSKQAAIDSLAAGGAGPDRLREHKPQPLLRVTLYTDNHRPGKIFAQCEDLGPDGRGTIWTKSCDSIVGALERAAVEVRERLKPR